MEQRHIGLIGFGAIGRDVVSTMTKAPNPPRFTVLRRQASAMREAGLDHVASTAALIESRPDLVVEVAGHTALETIVPDILAAGISVVAASAGSLVQRQDGVTLASSLRACAARSGARIIVPSGAIGGLDYLAAVSVLPGVKVVYTSRKPPAAWREELDVAGLAQEAREREIVFFEGCVEDAAKQYPKNLNVAATIALALGRDASLVVRVVVDPRARGNTHEIEIDSAAGQARLEFVNAPSPANPKTSLVTALSVIQSISAFFETRPQRRKGD